MFSRKSTMIATIFIAFMYLIPVSVFAAGNGTLVVIAQDASKKQIAAPIYVDNELRGTGKVTLTLPAKKHKVKFGDMEGYAVVSPRNGKKNVLVKAGKTTTVEGTYKAATGTYTASGTYTWNSTKGKLTFNTTKTDFVCEGPELGTETHTGVTITSTTITWSDDGSPTTWTRSSGTSGDIVGTWTSTDSETGNSWTLTFNADGTFSATGNIVKCGDNGGGGSPSAPTGVSVTAGNASNTISWSNVSDATSYNLYWSTSSGVTTSTGTKITGVTNPYTHTGLTNGTMYYYIITAVNSYGESSASSQVSAMPTSGGTTDTTPPTDGILSATVWNQYISLIWSDFSDSSGIGSYELVYSTSSLPASGNSTGTRIYLGADTSYTHESLTNGTTYYYRVCATDTAGNTSSGATAVAVPSAIVNTPATIASGVYDVKGIAVDSTNVYWTESTDGLNVNSGTVKKVSINGGMVTTLASGLNNPYGIAIDSTNVFWTESLGGTVKKVSKTGGTVTTLASKLGSPYGIVVDPTNVYWTEAATDGSGNVKKVSINGGTVTTIASIPSLGAGVNSIAIDSMNVYWMFGSEVKKVSINGGTITTLASSATSSPTDAIAVDSTNVYWTGDGPLKKVSINGGTVTTLAPGLVIPMGIAVDSTNVYWTERGSGVKKVSINGGTVIPLAASGVPGTGIAIDSTNVYWEEDLDIKKIAQ